MAAETVYDRIHRLVLELGLTDRGACAKAGLSETYLSQLKDRCDAKPTAGVNADAASSLARVLETSVEYLIRGAGPRLVAGDLGDPYPERQLAIRAAQVLGVGNVFIDRIMAHDPGRDPGRWYWFNLITTFRSDTEHGPSIK